VTDPVSQAHPEPPPRRIRVDVTPLRVSPDFRRLWCSGLVTYFGSLATYVALPFQIKELTGSVALAGLLGAAEVIPIVVFGLWGGALADAVDRRRMVVVTEACLLVLTGLLLVNALLPGPQVWVIFVVAALFATVDSLQRPSLDALLAVVVPHELMTAAAALSSVRYAVGGIAGPALAGVLLTTAGTWSAYAFDVATTAVSLAFLLRVTHVHVPAAEDAVVSLSRVAEGMRYAWSRKDLLGTYVVDVLAMVFGMTVGIYPFLAVTLDAPWALGLLYSAESLGALVVSATSGWTARVHRHGRAVVFAAAVYGLAMASVGLAPGIWLGLVALAVAGGADMVSGVFRMAIWNQSVPTELRGRLAGIELLSYSVGPVAGNARAGLVASATSVRTAVVSGGLLVTSLTLVAGLSMRSLWRYDERTDPHVRARRQASHG
jgi:MFS family permease